MVTNKPCHGITDGITNDVTVLILSRLPLRDVTRCGAVCRAWRELTAAAHIRKESASRDTPWLVLHRRATGDRPDHLSAYSAACRGWFTLGSVPRLLDKKSTSRWNRPSLVASADGLVCCVYSPPLPSKPASLAVFNPMTPASLRSTARYVLPLDMDDGFRLASVEALAIWKKRDVYRDYGVVMAGPISPFESSWGILVMDLFKRSMIQRSIASVDAITGRGFLSLLCSSLRDEDDGRIGLLCVWGMRSKPEMVVHYSIQDDRWRILRELFPESISWQCTAIVASSRQRFIAQVHPNLLICQGRLLVLGLRRESIATASFGLQIWELEPGPRGWIELRSMPEEMGREICGDSDEDCGWLHVRAVASGGVVYVVMDWGWKIRVLAHEFIGSGEWRWMSSNVWRDGFAGHFIHGCIFPFYPSPYEFPD